MLFIKVNLTKNINIQLKKENEDLKIKLQNIERNIQKYATDKYGDNIITKPGERLLAINFMPLDQSFIKPMICKNTDTLAMLEQKIYNEYTQFKEYHTYLTVGGELIKRFKTIDENGIKDSSSIVINFYK